MLPKPRVDPELFALVDGTIPRGAPAFWVKASKPGMTVQLVLTQAEVLLWLTMPIPRPCPFALE